MGSWLYYALLYPLFLAFSRLHMLPIWQVGFWTTVTVS